MTICAVLLAAICSAQEPAPPPRPAAAPRTETWSGYLFRDKEGHVQIGWPVVAMGVMAQASHTIEGELAEKLTPFVSAVKEDYFFWNYALEETGSIESRAFPRALVMVRGEVPASAEQQEGISFSSMGTPKAMRNARLLEIELVDDAWLEAWALFFRDTASPFRVAKKVDDAKASRARFAKEALAALRRMRAVPGPSAERREEVKRIAPDAKFSTRFRADTETDIQRWLVEGAEKGELELGDLKDLPPLPPSTVEIQRLFLESKDLAAFLAAVKARWPGELFLLSLVHYESNDRGSTWYESTPLDAVAAEWSEELFACHLATTKATLKR